MVVARSPRQQTSTAPRYPLATNPRVAWAAEEDALILRCMTSGVQKWSEVAALLPGRNRKQCRERWYNQINPAIRKGEWTKQEDALLEYLHEIYGNRWSEIAKRVEGRYGTACGARSGPRFFAHVFKLVVFSPSNL
jgi:hypothetical protein